ncbi:MAG TPA: EboA domain-containing protein [bacterium]|nr:EboA domain-containing protein [bacterium]
MKELLYDLLRTRAPAPALAWLDKALADVTGAMRTEQVLGIYAGASRRMGKQALALSDAERDRLRALDAEVVLDHWGMDEAARALLLLSLPDRDVDTHAERVLACYEKGDSREQESWLRGLAVLPQPERWVLTAVDACRTNILPMFEAITCENPFPARHFPELNFNQMVLKALFNGVALARIVGLGRRANAELSRMSDDYVSEREAAGRAVPVDIWVALAPHATPAALERVYRYLEHESPAHRYWAAVGLGAVAGDEPRRQLVARRAAEADAKVREAVEVSLSRLG